MKAMPVVQKFTQLSDVDFKTYFGKAGKYLIVKDDESGLTTSLVSSNTVYPELLSEVNVASNVTSITFNGLNINNDGAYLIEVKMVSTTAGWKHLRMYINGDTNESNYRLRSINARRGTIAVENYNLAWVLGYQYLSHAYYLMTRLHNTATITRGFAYLTNTAYNPPHFLYYLQNWYLANHTNVTSLTFTSTETNGIRVGSRIAIYKYKIF